MSRILIIEDEPALLRALADSFQFESYEVVTAEDGEAGLRLVREKKPDLVILDLMLPRMSGYEVCRKLRSDGVEIPILMLTARGEEADRVLGLDLGADDYVTKPFSILELGARVRALMRRARRLHTLPDSLRFGDVTVPGPVQVASGSTKSHPGRRNSGSRTCATLVLRGRPAQRQRLLRFR